jgi:hypothetical protein
MSIRDGRDHCPECGITYELEPASDDAILAAMDAGQDEALRWRTYEGDSGTKFVAVRAMNATDIVKDPEGKVETRFFATDRDRNIYIASRVMRAAIAAADEVRK